MNIKDLLPKNILKNTNKKTKIIKDKKKNKLKMLRKKINKLSKEDPNIYPM